MELTATQLIKLYMHAHSLVGNIHYLPTPEARLLDALNGQSGDDLIKKERFLELTDVTIFHDTGNKEKIKATYVSKSAVQLAVTLGDENSGRGVGSHTGPKSYPYMKKQPIPVFIQTPDYSIIGNMYHTAYQSVWFVLEDTPLFLPLTKSKVCSLSNKIWEEYPFVAVNKRHVLFLQQDEKKEWF